MNTSRCSHKELETSSPCGSGVSRMLEGRAQSEENRSRGVKPDVGMSAQVSVVDVCEKMSSVSDSSSSATTSTKAFTARCYSQHSQTSSFISPSATLVSPTTLHKKQSDVSTQVDENTLKMANMDSVMGGAVYQANGMDKYEPERFSRTNQPADAATALHRSMSEPLKPLSTTNLQMHRTISEVPFEQVDKQLRHIRNRAASLRQMVTVSESSTPKHMEGRRPGAVKAQAEAREDGEKVTMETPAKQEEDGDNVSSSSWETVSASDDEKPPHSISSEHMSHISSSGELSPDSKHNYAKGDVEAASLDEPQPMSVMSQPHNSRSSSMNSQSRSLSQSNSNQPATPVSMDKLRKNMDYVLSTIRKRMDPERFHSIQPQFSSKILANENIQYGYRNKRIVMVGSGEFGEVAFGKLKDTELYIALKALKKEKSDLFSLVHEAFMLQMLSDTGYVARYYGLVPIHHSFSGKKLLPWGIVCEFVGTNEIPLSYDFRKTLHAARNQQYTVDLVLQWICTAAKVVHAVQTFHQTGMLVNDIKADNILLRPEQDAGYHPIFIDFGLASIEEGITLALEVNESNKAKILKEYSHIAPEVLFGGETNVQSDIFSMGKALSLVSDAFPVEPFTALINSCCNWNAADRPSTSAILLELERICKGICL